MCIAKIILTLYGLFLLLGAYMGWKKGSKISLIMGLVSGTLVLMGIYLTNTNPMLGYRFITIISGILSFVFLQRLIKTRKFMPSGMLLVMSIIAFIVAISQWRSP